jgi:cytochrome c oxidase cbb3-type subunit 3
MSRTPHILRICLIATFVPTAALSCKREARSFNVPPAAALAPEQVPFNNPVRPGTGAEMTEASSQPVDLDSRAHSIYGTLFPANAQAMSDGQRLYEAFNCSGCHAHGGGGMGPPLLDNKWYYGSQPDQVYASILEGRPNGMPSFRGRIPDYQIWEIVAYVRSLSGQADRNASGGREDHMAVPQLPPNSVPPQQPQAVPEPTTGPATRSAT